jgi:uncharacterized protein YjiS (DUF1127 family)
MITIDEIKQLKKIADKLDEDDRQSLLAIALKLEKKNTESKQKLNKLTRKNESNDKRVEEAITIVKKATKLLKKDKEWKNLGNKQRLILIQKQVQQLRGIGISRATLYREWIKPIWQRPNSKRYERNKNKK